jgi:hypothetical protein
MARRQDADVSRTACASDRSSEMAPDGKCTAIADFGPCAAVPQTLGVT